MKYLITIYYSSGVKKFTITAKSINGADRLITLKFKHLLKGAEKMTIETI